MFGADKDLRSSSFTLANTFRYTYATEHVCLVCVGFAWKQVQMPLFPPYYNGTTTRRNDKCVLPVCYDDLNKLTSW